MVYTINYLLATYLQTQDGGAHKIQKVEKVRPGKAKFFFNVTPEEHEKIKLKFHSSAAAEYEQVRKRTIDLCYIALFFWGVV